MARPLRLDILDDAYHVWNRGANRADIVFDDGDRERFVDLLQEVVRRFGWIIHQFTLMTDPDPHVPPVSGTIALRSRPGD